MEKMNDAIKWPKRKQADSVGDNFNFEALCKKVVLVILLIGASPLFAQSISPMIIDTFFTESPDTLAGYLGSHRYPNLWKLTTPTGVTIAESDHKVKMTLPEQSHGYMNTQLLNDINLFSNSGAKFQFIAARISHQNLSQTWMASYSLTVGSGGGVYWGNTDDGFQIKINANKKLWLYFKKNGIQTTLIDAATMAEHAHSIELRIWKKDVDELYYHLWISHQSMDNSWQYDDYSADRYYGTVQISETDWGNGSPASGASVVITAGNGETDGLATVNFELAEFNVWPGDISPSGTTINQLPPGYTDIASYNKGCLDVTKAPYNAAGDGIADDTNALTQAILDGYDYDLAVYLPADKTFKVTDTIYVMQKQYMKTRYNTWSAYDYESGKPCFGTTRGTVASLVIGGTNGSKPVIKLADNSTGFDSSLTPRPVVAMFCVSTGENNKIAYIEHYDSEQANIGFDSTIRGVKIVCGNNAGAVGLRYGGAQGNTVEDVEIDATNAYVGLHGMSGVAGGMYNIKITGGQIGILADTVIDGRFPQLAGITLYDQTSRAIKYNHKGSGAAFAGLDIRMASGTAIEAYGNTTWSRAGEGNIQLVDAKIEFTDDTANNTVYKNADDNTMYMRNVYVKNADTIIDHGTAVDKAGNPTGWARVNEYANLGTDEYKSNGDTPIAVIDGVVFNETSPGLNTIVVDNVSTTLIHLPPSDIASQHVWDESTFPSSDDVSLINVMDQDGDGIYGELGDAKGDGSTDDITAIQTAINNGATQDKTVFFPKGIYKVSAPMTIKKNSKIIGIKTFSHISPIKASWVTNGYENMAVITTEDAADATAMVGFLNVDSYPLDTKNGGWEWKLGRQSILRNPAVSVYDYWGTYSNQNTYLYKFTGNAGGMIHAPCPTEGSAQWWSQNPDFRHTLILNTTEPLRFYGLNPERCAGDYQAEVKNSKNVFFLGMKSEYDQYMLGVVNSNNITVVGHNISGAKIFKVVDSEDVTIAGSTTQWKDTGTTNITEVRNSTQVVNITDTGCLSVFKRGNATMVRSDTININADFTVDHGGLSGGANYPITNGEAVNTTGTDSYYQLSCGNSTTRNVKMIAKLQTTDNDGNNDHAMEIRFRNYDSAFYVAKLTINGYLQLRKRDGTFYSLASTQIQGLTGLDYHYIKVEVREGNIKVWVSGTSTFNSVPDIDYTDPNFIESGSVAIVSRLCTGKVDDVTVVPGVY